MEQRLGKGWDLISLLKPYIVDLTSLRLFGACGAYFGPILNLYANTYPLGSLKSLSVDELDRGEFVIGPFVWPTNALHGLTCLKLRDMHKDTRLGMDGLVKILASSPALHTLQLDSALPTTDSGHSYPEINLPCLRLLRLQCLNSGALPILLSILVPGSLEVDVRLVLDMQIDRTSSAAIQSFLKRANITRLSLSGGPIHGTSWLGEQLDCVPKLQLLALERGIFDSWDILDALMLPTTEGNFGARCPNLRLLRMDGGAVNLREYSQLKRVVECHQLSTIIFGDETIVIWIRKEVIEWLRQRIGKVAVHKSKRRFEAFEDWD
ncbi:hypothetical protein FRC12_022049 [Ceratobasidium sp. 428]|nr:hypothetical protein FRC12_022049 [Ceratobasidium sp. 428]